jgi:hypothetical protein
MVMQALDGSALAPFASKRSSFNHQSDADAGTENPPGFLTGFWLGPTSEIS